MAAARAESLAEKEEETCAQALAGQHDEEANVGKRLGRETGDSPSGMSGLSPGVLPKRKQVKKREEDDDAGLAMVPDELRQLLIQTQHQAHEARLRVDAWISQQQRKGG